MEDLRLPQLSHEPFSLHLGSGGCGRAAEQGRQAGAQGVHGAGGIW